MQVVIAETLYPEGHKKLNKSFIELISANHDVTLLNNNNYFSIESKKVNVIDVFQFKPKYFEIIYTIVYFINIVLIAIKIRNLQYDKLIFLSTRIDSLYFALPLFKKNSIVVVHHNDIDRMLNRPFENCIFKRYMNKISHVVLADFIKEGLIRETKVDNENVHVVYQPCVHKVDIDQLKISERKNLIIGLGQSLSSAIITDLIKLDTNRPIKWYNYLKIRSKNVEYNSNNLEVSSKYLSDEEYYNRLADAVACLVIYPKSFNYRYSGVIDDALSHGLVVYCNDIPVSKYFMSLYPNSCRPLKDLNELLTILSSKVNPADESEIQAFINSHSSKKVADQWNHVIVATTIV